ncbi:hypothetical protein T492DRAFT_841254 [Pavlovales sp. CCMP2436]|nr:hypothetical protein T492DRAFT_841254 [Pavlovales sp. CCMP2436]
MGQACSAQPALLSSETVLSDASAAPSSDEPPSPPPPQGISGMIRGLLPHGVTMPRLLGLTRRIAAPAAAPAEEPPPPPPQGLRLSVLYSEAVARVQVNPNTDPSRNARLHRRLVRLLTLFGCGGVLVLMLYSFHFPVARVRISQPWDPAQPFMIDVAACDVIVRPAPVNASATVVFSGLVGSMSLLKWMTLDGKAPPPLDFCVAPSPGTVPSPTPSPTPSPIPTQPSLPSPNSVPTGKTFDGVNVCKTFDGVRAYSIATCRKLPFMACATACHVTLLVPEGVAPRSLHVYQVHTNIP